jgi:hypothetical protein
VTRIFGMFLIAIVSAMAVGCSGCQHNPPPQASYPGWDGAAVDYSPPDGPASCLDVARAGLHLGCTWAQPTPAGASFVDVCANNQAANISPWNLDCMARAKSCSAVDACNR